MIARGNNRDCTFMNVIDKEEYLKKVTKYFWFSIFLLHTNIRLLWLNSNIPSYNPNGLSLKSLLPYFSLSQSYIRTADMSLKSSNQYNIKFLSLTISFVLFITSSLVLSILLNSYFSIYQLFCNQYLDIYLRETSLILSTYTA